MFSSTYIVLIVADPYGSRDGVCTNDCADLRQTLSGSLLVFDEQGESASK